ncbi:uncharacterized protein LOC132929337 isoform X2 [Rhopalosiphum padi]|uniref:uncharacterized protein LOC132929337 isoform X2 n=1 Tax=Rhopalosiphum padi TaxID=40932 RepID=UPI00298E0539|nr:uncharacterized protein LOC132929337 isoform X2 [Rhopalosiphum padi]
MYYNNISIRYKRQTSYCSNISERPFKKIWWFRGMQTETDIMSIFRPTSKALASLYPRRQVWQGYLVVRLRRISHRRRFTVRRLRPLVYPPHSATIRTVYTRQPSLYTLYTPPPPTTTTNTRRWRRRHVETNASEHFYT